jgi:hypothetical protein
MKSGTAILVILLGACGIALCNPALAQAPVGGPKKQVAVGGPAKPNVVGGPAKQNTIGAPAKPVAVGRPVIQNPPALRAHYVGSRSAAPHLHVHPACHTVPCGPKKH